MNYRHLDNYDKKIIRSLTFRRQKQSSTAPHDMQQTIYLAYKQLEHHRNQTHIKHTAPSNCQDFIIGVFIGHYLRIFH